MVVFSSFVEDVSRWYIRGEGIYRAHSSLSYKSKLPNAILLPGIPIGSTLSESVEILWRVFKLLRVTKYLAFKKKKSRVEVPLLMLKRKLKWVGLFLTGECCEWGAPMAGDQRLGRPLLPGGGELPSPICSEYAHDVHLVFLGKQPQCLWVRGMRGAVCPNIPGCTWKGSILMT